VPAAQNPRDRRERCRHRAEQPERQRTRDGARRGSAQTGRSSNRTRLAARSAT
jgi:hypothetical protein